MIKMLTATKDFEAVSKHTVKIVDDFLEASFLADLYDNLLYRICVKGIRNLELHIQLLTH